MKLELVRANLKLERKHDVALITGDGRSLPKDLEGFLSHKIPHDVVAIGRSINHYPGEVLHWANVDGADSKWWAENLPKKNNGGFPIRHSMGDLEWYDVDWEADDLKCLDDEVIEYKNTDFEGSRSEWHGSSAFFAVLICLELGYEKIILAGCPLDSEGHWYFPPEHKGPEWGVKTIEVWIDFAKDERAKKVRSLSGLTRKILGFPEGGWI